MMYQEEAHSLIADPAEAPGALAARTRPYLLGLLAGLGVAEVVSLTGIAFSPRHLFGDGLFLVFACLSVFLVHCTAGRRRFEIGTVAGIGSAEAIAAQVWLGGFFLMALSGGLAVASVVVLSVEALRSKGAERRAVLDVLLPALAFPGFVFASLFCLALTAALRPAVWDGYALLADASFGFQASFLVGRLFKAARPLARFSTYVYYALPLGLAAVHALATRSRLRTRAPDVVAALVVIGVAGFALYFMFPVVGPVFVLRWYPFVTPSAVSAALGPFVAAPMPRNCMPSLHAGWALMAFWLAWPYGRWARVVAGTFLGFTLLATLGLGLHYLVDLVAAVPFVAAVYAFLAHVEPGSVRLRRATMVGGATLLLGWLALVRFAPNLFAGAPPVMWVVAGIVIGLPWAAVLMIQRRAATAPAILAASPRLPAATVDRARLGVAGAFFLSGLAALSYQVVFAKASAFVYGSTARAATAGLAVLMGGLALGSWLGGALAYRIARPLRAFALVQIGVALWCAGFPLAFAGVRAAYLALAAGADPAAAWLVFLQMALQAAALLPATLLMGCSLPLLARHLCARAEGVGSAVGRLYGVSTAGAAAGALLGGYLLLPSLGVTRTVFVAVAFDLLAAVIAIRLSARAEGRPQAAPSPPGFETCDAPARLRRLGWIALVVTFLGGVVTFALGTTYVHLLAVVAGNSPYAFTLMLFAFLVGLSGGAGLGRRLLRTGIGLPMLLAACQLGLVFVLLIGAYLWDGLPAHFASYEQYPIVREFGAREVVRFAVCGVAMIPAALFVGAAYPLVMAWVGAANPGREIAAIGRAVALNLVGNILGAVLAGFALIPRFGSLRSIQAIAAVTFALGLLALLAAERRRPGWGLVLVMAAGLFLLQPKSFDYTQLASGANIYFANQAYGHVIDHAESQDGGLTTVVQAEIPRGRRVTMLANGNFRGDYSRRREMAARLSSSLFPLLHSEERGPALIIGLGTGVSARVASDAGFTPVHIAEISRDVADLAARHFAKPNGGVLSRPNTVLHVADGRNLLALDSRRYGFIGMETSSIWFAGVSGRYNQEFYATARSRLTERGVLQQWVQMDRLARSDLLSVVATARAEFPHVWLYLAPEQGVLVACQWDCRPSESTARRLAAEPKLAVDLGIVGGAAKLLEQRVLGPDEVDQLIADARKDGEEPGEFVSTDDNLRLEYSTPRANVRPYAPSLADNIQFVRRLKPQSPLAGTRLTLAEWEGLRADPSHPVATP